MGDASVLEHLFGSKEVVKTFPFELGIYIKMDYARLKGEKQLDKRKKMKDAVTTMFVISE